MIPIVIASAVARSLPWFASWAGAWSHSLGLSRNSWHDYALMTMAREVVKDTDIGGLYVVGPMGASRHIDATITDNSVC